MFSRVVSNYVTLCEKVLKDPLYYHLIAQDAVLSILFAQVCIYESKTMFEITPLF